MGFSGGKSREEKDREARMERQSQEDRAATNAAIAKAAEIDPLEQRRRDRVAALDDWETGKSGPIDIRKMPGGGAQIALYQGAKTVTDAGRQGRGYGTMDDGSNPGYSAALGQEQDQERSQAASGALEQNVNNTLAGKDQEMYGLAGMNNARNMQVAGLQQSGYNSDANRWLSYLMRPRQSFLKQLALRAMGQVGQVSQAIAA